MSIHLHKLRITRKSIQGCISNEEYDVTKLYDSRLTNHIPTHAILKLKNFKEIGKDSPFTDAQSIDEPIKYAEGKCINSKRGVVFRPSVDTGAKRNFSQENLDKCFSINSFYFLYETTSHDDTYVNFDIYWIPIEIICNWYKDFGNKQGIISYKNFKNCIKQHQDQGDIVQTQETRD